MTQQNDNQTVTLTRRDLKGGMQSKRIESIKLGDFRDDKNLLRLNVKIQFKDNNGEIKVLRKA